MVLLDVQDRVSGVARAVGSFHCRSSSSSSSSQVRPGLATKPHPPNRPPPLSLSRPVLFSMIFRSITLNSNGLCFPSMRLETLEAERSPNGTFSAESTRVGSPAYPIPP
mmetsp:Transcript_42053/g.127559  ORF Transcript_42053/g.127559 Transcript_42053/m.127559 type:complete len:109 (-) Transcript_42053:285-611(-)